MSVMYCISVFILKLWMPKDICPQHVERCDLSFYCSCCAHNILVAGFLGFFFFLLFSFLYIQDACVSKGLSYPCGAILESTISQSKPVAHGWILLSVRQEVAGSWVFP